MGRTALCRFGSPDPRGHPRYPENRASNDRSRLKGGHIGESPCLSKEKLAGMGPSGREGAEKAGKCGLGWKAQGHFPDAFQDPDTQCLW